MPYKDRKKFNEYRNKWVRKQRVFWDSLKRKPCTDCGVQYNPWQMQWDHINDDKSFTIGKFWQYSKARVLAEIEKCELVCANCHADRTYNRARLVEMADTSVLETDA